MTVLQVVQRAATRCGLDIPSSLTGTDRTLVEIVEVVNEAARTLRDEYDWQALKRQAALTGDGTSEAFDLPSDYARMSKNAHIWPANTPNWPLDHVTDEDDWLRLNAQNYTYINGRWMVFGGQINIKPAPANAVVLNFFYISNGVFMNGTSRISAVDDDNNTFVLDENLLKLAFVWQWKMKAGQSYEAELDQYEEALAVAVGSDKGPRATAIGLSRYPYNARTAYPGSIVP